MTVQHKTPDRSAEQSRSERPELPNPEWDDPTKSDDERWEEYKRRYDLIVLPPKRPDDPKEGEYERIPGSFELPLSRYPGWRMGFVPKGVLRLRPLDAETDSIQEDES